MTTPDQPTPVVAIIGNGATHSGKPALDRYVEVVHDLTGLPTRVMPLDHELGHRLQSSLRVLHGTVAAVLLLQTAPSPPGEPLVLTDEETTAIALTAAVLTTLTRAGRSPQSSRVVIAGARTMPTLSPLLMTAGVGDIAAWNPSDAPTFPLRHISAGADAVVDLLDGAATFVPHTDPVVITAHDHDPLLALPGLLLALAQTPQTRPSVEVYLACAFALVMATPPDQRLPTGPDQALTDRVADAATQALRYPHDTSPTRPAP